MATKRVNCPACGGPFRVDAMAYLDLNRAELVGAHGCDADASDYVPDEGNDSYTAPAGGDYR